MAGMHFIILKVNGVDVSQMPHEEAVQMFLKASEPILVEVRRRSYNTNTDAKNSNNHNYLEKPNELSHQLQQQQKHPRRQSSPTTMSLMTSESPAENYNHQQTDQLLPMSTATTTAKATSAVVDSLKFHSLVISSSKSSIGLESCSNTRQRRIGETNPAGVSGDGSLPIGAAATRTSSASVSDNQIENRSSMNEASNNKSRSGSISSITSSSVRSIPPSPLKEPTTTILPVGEGDDKNSKGLVSIGIQTDNFTTDFIFNGSSILNSEQMIENDHNLFSECLAPEIDIEEITLRKSEGNERLGLTVCYSSGGGNGSGSDDTDTCTDVYISDIVPDSIAGRDGRLRQGDQILQVNGKDVSNKEETETLIAENNNAVTLLVSRYLYGDDDEYNEQGDFFEEDEPNMAYTNCFLENYIVSEDLLKSASNSNQGSPDKKQKQTSEEFVQLEQQQPPARSMPDVVATSVSDNTPATTTLGSSLSRDPLNHKNIRAHLEQVNQEIAILDSRVENMMMSQKKNIDPSCVAVQKLPQHSQSQQEPHIQPQQQPKETSVMPIMDYDTEHIYETIPEDSESEPFYCSPYESSEHQNRIEQWLDMQDGSESNDTRIRSLQNHKHQFIQQQHHDNLSIWAKAKNGTLHSTNSSAGDDHENSSSAYNTGGSCNSTTMTPLTLELNTTNYRDHELNNQPQSTLVLCSTKHIVSPINETTSTPVQHRLPLMHNSSQEFHQLSSIINQQRHSKDKLPSPSHSSAKTSSHIMLLNKQKISQISQKNPADLVKSAQNNLNTPISAASNTMYTNVANLQQTMLLQQQLFRQALIHQRVPSVPCPQFTAPNLSQYHFVSSQEVSAVKLNTHQNEEHMVWKVKRRQDGTRYIVRRPARNRFLRNRALRISAERNDQTTEDDTISEIKTGRYWTKEERKKHIERARERRQRQQIIITNKNNEISMLPQSSSPLNNLIPETAQKMIANCGGDSSAIQQNQQQQSKIIPPIQSPAATTGAKVYRQSNPSSSATKKLVKKITTNSPVDVNVINSPLITSNPPVTGAPSSSSTTPSGSTRMFQGSNGGIGSVADNITSYQARVIHPPL